MRPDIEKALEILACQLNSQRYPHVRAALATIREELERAAKNESQKAR